MQASGKRYISYPSRKDTIKIWNIADIHLGNKACEKDRLARDIATIKNDPYSFWIGGGDYADYIGYEDKRFDPQSVDQTLSIMDLGDLGYVLTRRVRDLFEPIKDKCLGLIYGNHEEKYMKNNTSMELHNWLCTELGVRNLGYSAFVDIVFWRRAGGQLPKLGYKAPGRNDGSRFQQRLYIHHGAGGATTPGGKINRLIKFMDSFEADVYMVGHVHDQLMIKRPVLMCNQQCDDIQERVRIGMISGAYLKTYAQDTTGYGEMKGFAPVPLGAVYIEIVPDKKEVYARI